MEDLPRDMELDEDERDAADDETPDDGEEATGEGKEPFHREMYCFPKLID